MGRKHDMQIADMVGKPIGEKMEQLEAAVYKDGEQTRLEYKQQIGEIKKVVDVVLEDLSSREKKELYDLNTLIDISTLEETEKRFLVETLYTLAGMTDQITETQQAFIRSVQKYLGIKNVQTMIDLVSIENIENIPTQKALLQTIMEFLFLENNNHVYMSEYEDVLSYFSVNKKGIQEIQSAIDNIFCAVGAQGMSEKYGYVAEFEVEPEDSKTQTMLEEIYLSEKLLIEAGSERIFSNASINLNNGIECEGKLRFENCQIYSEGPSNKSIIWAENADIIFNNCSIAFEQKDSETMIRSDNSRISFVHCELHKCKGLLYGNKGSISFDSCQSEDLNNRNIVKAFRLENFQIKGCEFKMEPHRASIKIDPYYGDSSFSVDSKTFSVSESIFSGFTNGVFRLNSEAGDVSIKKVKFISCANVFESRHQEVYIEQSEFEQCIHLFNVSEHKKFQLSNCQFYESIGMIRAKELCIDGCVFKNGIPHIVVGSYIDGSGSCAISNCVFENWDLQQMCNKILLASQNNNNYYNFTTENEILGLLSERSNALIELGNNGKLQACKFSNIKITPIPFLVGCSTRKSATLSYCYAENCQTTETMLDRKVYSTCGLFFQGKESQATYYLNNCNGFDS